MHLGFGLRASAYAGDPTTYTNRGPTQGSPAPSVVVDPAVYVLNGAVFSELDITDRVAVGANLDVIGGATGIGREAAYSIPVPR